LGFESLAAWMQAVTAQTTPITRWLVFSDELWEFCALR
jgi:hypothetical protein